MLKHIPIAALKIGRRHRKDMGDLTTLAESFRQWWKANRRLR